MISSCMSGPAVFLNWFRCLACKFPSPAEIVASSSSPGLGCQAGREIKHLLSAPKSRWLQVWGQKNIANVMTSRDGLQTIQPFADYCKLSEMFTMKNAGIPVSSGSE